MQHREHNGTWLAVLVPCSFCSFSQRNKTPYITLTPTDVVPHGIVIVVIGPKKMAATEGWRVGLDRILGDEEFGEVMRHTGKMVIGRVSVNRNKLRVFSQNEITIFGRRAWIAVYLNSTQRGDSVGYLGIFVMFAGGPSRTRWKAHLDAQFSVLSSVATLTKSRTFSVDLDETAADWGFSKFMALDHLYNENNGYIEQDTLRIQYTISANSGTVGEGVRFGTLPLGIVTPLTRSPRSPVQTTSDTNAEQAQDATADNGIGVEDMDMDTEEALTCRICFEAPRNALPLTCKHLCMCLGCAAQVEQCPICRASFSPDEIAQVYLS